LLSAVQLLVRSTDFIILQQQQHQQTSTNKQTKQNNTANLKQRRNEIAVAPLDAGGASLLGRRLPVDRWQTFERACTQILFVVVVVEI
jgi:hypothetical protein